MPCKHVDLGNGATAIICSGRRPMKRCHVCGNKAPFLCDYPVTTNKSGTCDRPMCEQHRENMAPEIDYCLTHAEHDRKIKSAQPKDETVDWEP